MNRRIVAAALALVAALPAQAASTIGLSSLLVAYYNFEYCLGVDQSCHNRDLAAGEGARECEGLGGGTAMAGPLAHANEAGEFDLLAPRWSFQVWFRAPCGGHEDDPPLDILRTVDGWRLELRRADGVVAFVPRGGLEGGGAPEAVAPAPPCDEEHWTHVVVTSGGAAGGVAVHVDGVRGDAAALPAPGGGWPSGALLVSPAGEVKVDELAFWVRELHFREVEALHHDGCGLRLWPACKSRPGSCCLGGGDGGERCVVLDEEECACEESFVRFTPGGSCAEGPDACDDPGVTVVYCDGERGTCGKGGCAPFKVWVAGRRVGIKWSDDGVRH
jgi:hypothetical protein